MNLMKRKQEIEARLTEIRGLANNETDVEKLTAFETEVDKLQEERAMIEKKMNIASKRILDAAGVDYIKLDRIVDVNVNI